jgi:CheY-like chemotaxis protein
VNARILVVEDDLHIAALLGRELEHLGYGVVKAHSGTQALISIPSKNRPWCCWTSGCPTWRAARCCVTCAMPAARCR